MYWGDSSGRFGSLSNSAFLTYYWLVFITGAIGLLIIAVAVIRELTVQAKKWTPAKREGESPQTEKQQDSQKGKPKD
ncbi:hypothetical protein [Ammoniphilus sp. YIM 78166]|uniref:hypothetical protein n=1 Tax=Ammoniphilus sp. YIM 78166 TaxID=1644106 RepID=UPI00106F210E|nr:hypothetical protein [Ammoniphilus sp. YIM 78166]